MINKEPNTYYCKTLRDISDAEPPIPAGATLYILEELFDGTLICEHEENQVWIMRGEFKLLND